MIFKRKTIAFLKTEKEILEFVDNCVQHDAIQQPYQLEFKYGHESVNSYMWVRHTMQPSKIKIVKKKDIEKSKKK